MNKINFDINEGVLLTSAEPVVEQGRDPRDIYDLGLLLLNHTDVEVKPGLYPSGDYDNWERSDYEAHARWLLGIVTDVDPNIATPTEQVYERAFHLGVGPEPRRIRRRFGPLWQFHDELGFGGSYCRGKFEDWSTREFIEYGRRVVKGLHGKKPTEEAFQRWFDKRKGPSPALIRNRIGSVGKLQELIGFPLIADWSEDDYIEYGVKVALANPDINLTRDVFDELSRKKRGPSTRSIVNHFGKLGKYKGIIAQEVIFAAEQRQEWLENKAFEREKMFEDDLLPPELREIVDDENKKVMVQQTSIFLLAHYLLRDSASLGTKIDVALMNPRNVIAAIRTRDPSLTPGAIEVAASQLGIFDDIWPQWMIF